MFSKADDGCVGKRSKGCSHVDTYVLAYVLAYVRAYVRMYVRAFMRFNVSIRALAASAKCPIVMLMPTVDKEPRKKKKKKHVTYLTWKKKKREKKKSFQNRQPQISQERISIMVVCSFMSLSFYNNLIFIKLYFFVSVPADIFFFFKL